VFELDKSRVYLFENQFGTPQLVDSYYMSIGKGGIDKQIEGDNKTPLGVYRITSYLSDESLPELYGAGAYPINYPNSWDRLQGKTGHGIWLHGVPRATYMPFPFQIIHGIGKILVAYPFAGASRLIHMDDVGESPSDAWMGWSRGRWDGDTLVVDVTSFTDQTWFDRAGNFHSKMLHVVERYTPVSRNVMQYEATIEDPNVFTRPWKMSMPLYRRMEENAQLLEFKCVPFSEELLYGHLRKTTDN
jgi:hypothetical protein